MPDSRHFIAPFIGGLNTELSDIQDLPMTTSDERNCTIYSENVRGRRYGMNIERDGVLAALPVDQPLKQFQGYFWKNVAKTPVDFIVYLIDTTLCFYTAEMKPFSAYLLPSAVDISKYITDENKYYKYPVRFTSGAGILTVVSKYLQPLQISYDFVEQEFTVSVINLKVRDLDGVDDGLKVDETPLTLSDFHKYNLYNQGWNATHLNRFYTDKAQYPANSFQWFIGKDSSGNYNTEELLKFYFGNTPAPKGHYILNYFDKNRAKASGIYGGAARKATWAYANTWTQHRAYNAIITRSFTQEVPASSGTATAATLQFSRLSRKTWKRAWGPWNGNVDITIEGFKDDEWELVYKIRHYFYGTPAKGDNGAEVYMLDFSDNETAYDKYRFVIEFKGIEKDSFDANLYAWPTHVTANMQLYIAEDGDPFVNERSNRDDKVTDVTYMAGKYFYLVDDTVLFSQTITDEGAGYDSCFQKSDPTSEEVSDIYPTDGGYVKFQTMGAGLALKTFNRGVLVFGRDVVWGLISPLNGRFTATDYDTVELSKAGLIGPQSVVNVADNVYYWSPLGIFRVGVNPQTGSTMIAENISQLTIQSFYNNIPTYAKEKCRAAFDYCSNRIYWFYPLNGEDMDNLNGVLVYDLNYNAFMPMQISEGGRLVALFDTLNSYEIEPTVYLRAGEDRVVADDMKVVAVEETNEYNRFTAICHCAVINLKGQYLHNFEADLTGGSFTILNITGALERIRIHIEEDEEEIATIVVKGVKDGVTTTIKTFTDVTLTDSNIVLDVDADLNYDSYEIDWTLSDDIHAVCTIEFNSDGRQWGATLTDFNDREFKDWDKSQYDSYMVSHPISIEGTSAYGTEYSGTFAHKQVPILQTLIKRTEKYQLRNGEYTTASGAYLRMRWGWSLNGLSNRWDIVQNAYRPQKDFLHDEYVESRLHIRGRGRAYQIELRNDSNKDFRLAGMNSLVRNYAIGSVQ